MYGTEFANQAHSFFETYARQNGLQDHVSRVATIAANPEQSKHLETATLKIFDLWVDFVNLRAEDYTENSRIPVMVKTKTLLLRKQKTNFLTAFRDTVARCTTTRLDNQLTILQYQRKQNRRFHRLHIHLKKLFDCLIFNFQFFIYLFMMHIRTRIRRLEEWSDSNATRSTRYVYRRSVASAACDSLRHTIAISVSGRACSCRSTSRRSSNNFDLNSIEKKKNTHFD